MAQQDVEVARYRAPGGWRRALLGFAVGVLAGVLVALVLPRDDGPRRDTTRRRPGLDAPGDRDEPRGPDAT